MALALGALFFTGPLAIGYGVGVGAILLGSALVTFYVAWRSALKSSLAHVQETTVAVVAAAIVAVSVHADGTTSINTATVLAIIGTSSLIVGASFWLAGFFKLGGLLRFLPYPVVAGFLAGSGWLLVDGANIVLTGQAIGPGLVALLGDGDIALRYGLSVGLALALLIGISRFPNPFVLAGIIVLSLAVFALILMLSDFSIADARAIGLLPQITSAAGLEIPSPALMAQVDWQLVLTFAPLFVAVAGLNLVGFVLNVTGAEVALGRDLNTNGELRTNGIANLLAGGVGGAPGYLGLSMTLLSEHVGTGHRLVGMSAGLFVIVVLLFGGTLIYLVPLFMTGGMLLFLGLGLLRDWLVATRARMALPEWLIIVLILLTIALVGFMEGLAVGLLVSSVMFVFNYARLPVTRRMASLATLRSTVDRSPDERALLAQEGEKTCIIQLQGYLFFGTAERVLDLVRKRLANTDQPKAQTFIIDFSGVSGADSAAGSCFVKMQKLASQENLSIVFVHISKSLAKQFAAAGLTFGGPNGGTGNMSLEEDFDSALEHAEESVLQAHTLETATQELTDFFTSLVGADPRLDDLVSKLEPHMLEIGHTLIKTGAMSKDVYFVESGRVSVRVKRGDGTMMRVRSMVAGAIVGEMALYAGQARSADVVVDAPSKVYRLSQAVLADLEANDPPLAVLMHRILASSLAEKLATANQAITLR